MKKIIFLILTITLFAFQTPAFAQGTGGGSNATFIVNRAGSGIKNLGDVFSFNISSASSGHTLRYDGTNWVNASNLTNDGIDITLTGILNGVTINRTSGDLTLQTTTTGDIFLDPAGNTTIGDTVSGDGTLHVHTGTAGIVTAFSNANDLVIESNTNTGISIITPDDSLGLLAFDTPATSGTGAARIQWQQTGGGLFSVGTSRSGADLELRADSGSKFIRLSDVGNTGFNTSTFDASAAKVLAIGNGTAPAAITANQSYIWSQDFAAGDSRLYIMGEKSTDKVIIGNGSVIIANNRGLYLAGNESGLSIETSGGTDILFRAAAGTNTLRMDSNDAGFWVTDQPIITREISSATNPVHTFKNSKGYGLGGAPSSGYISLIANSVEGIRILADRIRLSSSVKTDTGDPASPASGDITINEFDNKIKIYADGAWRQLATW